MPEAQAQVNETPMVELDTGGNAVDVELKENKQQEVQEVEDQTSADKPKEKKMKEKSIVKTFKSVLIV